MIIVDMGYIQTLLSNSDVLGSDDVRSAPIITKITEIKIDPTATDKKYWIITLDGFEKKFKPCVTVRRILDSCWGASGVRNSAGRYIELYCDPDVEYHGARTGGVRISRVSHIDNYKDVPIKLSKTKKATIRINKITDDEILAYENALQKPKNKAEAAAAPNQTQSAPTAPAKDLKRHEGELTDAAKLGIEALKAAWTKIPEDIRPQLEAHKESCKKVATNAKPATTEPTDAPDIP